MAEEETLTERFNRLTSALSDTEVASIMGMTEGAVRKVRRGDTQSFDLHRALRLCDQLGIDPWYLALGRERTVSQLVSPGADRLQRVEDELVKTQERVDLLADLIRLMAGSKADRLEAEVAAEHHKRKRSVGA